MSAPTWSHAAAIAAELAFGEVPARSLKKTIVHASEDPKRAAQLLQRVGEYTATPYDLSAARDIIGHHLRHIRDAPDTVSTTARVRSMQTSLARRTRPYNRVKELHIPEYEGVTQKDVTTLRTESGNTVLARPQSQNKAAETKARRC